MRTGATTMLHPCSPALSYILLPFFYILMSAPNDPFCDLTRLQIPGQFFAKQSSRSRSPCRGAFLKGPIPWPWLARAAKLPGRALHVGLVLWFRAGLARGRTVTLPGPILESMGMDRHAAGRGLNALEEAHLVAMERHPGRKPLVTILDCPNGDSAAATVREIGGP